jgi:hypothetical protein
MSSNTIDKISQLSELGDRRHAEQGKTGAVNLNELLTNEEGSELVALLMSLPSETNPSLIKLNS